MLLAASKTLGSNYLDALDYLARLKNEKVSDTNVELFTLLYPNEIDILVKQGYFNSSLN